MSVLGIRVPAIWEKPFFLKMFRKTAPSIEFTFLSFKKTDGNKDMKTAFIRLSEKADPQMVIEKLETRRESGRWRAFIVDELPDIEPCDDEPFAKNNKTSRMNVRTTAAGKPVLSTVKSAHWELMAELQTKFNQLHKISKEKTDNHQLLQELSKKVFKRLAVVAKNSPLLKAFQLTSAYRRAHPHPTDCQLIVDTLHELEDADGRPRTELAESDLMQTPDSTLCVDSIPYDKIVTACNKYTNKITQKVNEHIAGLKTETIDGVDPYKRRVRLELKKISPYLPMIIRQVMSKHLVPEDLAFRKVRIYGEPFLPDQEVMRSVLRPFFPTSVSRVQTIFNLLWFSVPANKFAALLKLDNTPAGHGSNCKLVVRESQERLYMTPEHIMADLVKAFKE